MGVKGMGEEGEEGYREILWAGLGTGPKPLPPAPIRLVHKPANPPSSEEAGRWCRAHLTYSHVLLAHGTGRTGSSHRCSASKHV